MLATSLRGLPSCGGDRVGDRDAWLGQDGLWRQHGLWKETEGGDGEPAVGAPHCSPEGTCDVNPKAAPVLNVVGQAQRHEDIRTHTHALVQLEVVNAAGDETQRRIRWFDRLPVRTGGAGARVEFHGVEPPFSLSHPDAAAGARRELVEVEPALQRRINKQLAERGEASEVDFHAPIAPIVWENAFRSRRFVEGE